VESGYAVTRLGDRHEKSPAAARELEHGVAGRNDEVEIEIKVLAVGGVLDVVILGDGCIGVRAHAADCSGSAPRVGSRRLLRQGTLTRRGLTRETVAPYSPAH